MTGNRSDPLPEAFSELAELEYRLGDWPAAHASALRSLSTARSAGLDQDTMMSLVRLACIEAGLGRSRACRSHAAEAIELSRAHATPVVEALAGEAVGFLELGLGHIDAAIERLERVGELGVRNGTPATWATDLAEAYVRRGDARAARRTLERAGGRTQRRAAFVSAPALERTAALVADDGAYDRLFRRALAWSATAQQPFELARTELCFGERLQRAQRLPEARARVSAALGHFDALGARPWAVRARRILKALARTQAETGRGWELARRFRGGYSARLTFTAVP
jgi:tetratricopeptide (TPR) repeat protein